MKRSLLLSALFLGLVGCGGGGGNDRDAQSDVNDYLDRLESAYDYGVANNSQSRYASLISLNYCQDGRDRSTELDQFRFDINDAIDAGADQARIVNVSVDNAKYTDDDNQAQARVHYKVVFETSSGRDVLELPSFDDTLYLRSEGGSYRDIGNGQCDLTRDGAKPVATHRGVKPTP